MMKVLRKLSLKKDYRDSEKKISQLEEKVKNLNEFRALKA